MSQLKEFDCLYFATCNQPQKSKFNPRSHPAIFLGYPPYQKGFKVYDLHTHVVTVSRDVIFHEDIFPYKLSKFKLPSIQYDVLPIVPVDHILPNTLSTSTPVCNNPDSGFTQVDDMVDDNISPGVNDLTDNVHDTSFNIHIDHTTNSNNSSTRISTRDKRPPIWLNDYVVSNVTNNFVVIPTYTSALMHFVANIFKIPEPHTYKQACTNVNWIKAM
ncbi:hypothetical protein LIER_10425 [Lithospermum erythrorhizon]|uniref:Retroviral polymerase SH3-like domain-containing protein n=1 Tax=Lithospermum erythrorhizon TaxID=34254 RepID=A0AAV3PJE5_LITER